MKLNNLLLLKLVVVGSFCFISLKTHANILGLFPAGAGCKSAAMETAGDCTEAQTLLYNPAVMSRVTDGFNGELGVGKIQYSYEHPSFDAVRVNLATPIVSEGYKGSFLDHHATYGFAVMPASMADLNINGLPRRISGKLESLNVKAKRTTFHIPLGGSYEFSDTGFSLGGALIYTYDSRSLTGSSITIAGSNLVESKIQGHFVRPNLGATYNSGPITAGTSYMFPLAKKFVGKSKLAGSDEIKTEIIDYDPAVALFSLRGQLASFNTSANVNHVFGTRGKGIQRDDLNRKTETADFRDANHFGLRVGYQDVEWGEFSLAAAYIDSYWGDGYFYTDSDGIGHQEFGHMFGQFNGIPVHNQAATWKQKFSDWQTHVAIFRSAGTTTVANGGDNPGYYQINFMSLTCGVQRAL